MVDINKPIKCCVSTQYGLTFGKYYKIIETNFLGIKILNDYQIIQWYPYPYFFDNK